MFFATSECALFSRKPREVLEHFWWTSQWLQGLATYTDQVRASKVLLAILCLRQWHRNFFFFFTAVHYEQNRLLYSPWCFCWAELLLVTGIHPDHCASTVLVPPLSYYGSRYFAPTHDWIFKSLAEKMWQKSPIHTLWLFQRLQKCDRNFRCMCCGSSNCLQKWDRNFRCMLCGFHVCRV